MKILVIIPTHKRSNWCLFLLKQIKLQQKELDINVAVFHDWDISDYSEVEDYCNQNKWSYYKTSETFGKWRFWELNNIMYEYATGQDYDYVIQLPDDAILVDLFFYRICAVMQTDNDCINPFTLELHSGLFNKADNRTTNKYGELVPTNWADSCFITTKNVISKMRLSRPINSINQDDSKGTGCGMMFSNKYLALFKKPILQMRNALVFHRGYSAKSVMHDATKWAKTYESTYQSKMFADDLKYCKQFDNEEVVSDFRKLVEGKNIAFVGLAPNIKGKNLGKEIDSADVVYRTNMFPLPAKYKRDYGSRCDIIGIQKAYQNYIYRIIGAGVKAIVRYENGVHIPNDIISYCSDYNERKDMASQINSVIINNTMKAPTAGLVALFLCKKFGCKSFKFYGITGYQNTKGEVENHKGENNYIQEYLDYWGKRKDKLLSTDMVHNTYHNFQAHNEYIRYALKENIIELDPYSYEYFCY